MNGFGTHDLEQPYTANIFIVITSFSCDIFHTLLKESLKGCFSKVLASTYHSLCASLVWKNEVFKKSLSRLAK